MTLPAHAGHHDASAAWGPVVAVVLAAGYLLAAGADRRGWDHRRTAAWLAGCAVLAVALSPLVDGTGLRGHMAQHLLVGMFAPLGLVLGAPVTLLLRVASPRGRRRLVAVLRSRPVHVLAHPMTAAVLTAGGLAVIMLTPVFGAAQQHPWLHHALHLHYLAAGCLFTWAVAGPDPAPRRPGPPVRVAALVLAAGAHAVLAKYLYARATTPPAGLTGVDPDEVRAAAQLMYYGGDVAELLLAVTLFAAWYQRRGRRLRAVATA